MQENYLANNIDESISELYVNNSIHRVKRNIGDRLFNCAANSNIATILVQTQVAPSANQLVVYKSVYDKIRRVPLFTSYIFDDQNYKNQQGGFKKSCTFPVFGSCSSLNLNVPKTTDYSKSGYTRGHLMPWADWRNLNPSSTQYLLNYFINAAPQKSYFNYVMWSAIEAEVRNRLINSGAGVVATGLCLDSSRTFIGPNKDIIVPTCYWKFVCYMDNNTPTVYGYYGENKNYNSGDVLPIKTANDMINIAEVKTALLRILNVATLNWNAIWQKFFDQITSTNRNGGVTSSQCAAASQTSPSVSKPKLCGSKRKYGNRKRSVSVCTSNCQCNPDSCDATCSDCDCNPSCDTNSCPDSMACIQDNDNNTQCLPLCNSGDPNDGPSTFYLYTRNNQYSPVDITNIKAGTM